VSLLSRTGGGGVKSARPTGIGEWEGRMALEIAHREREGIEILDLRGRLTFGEGDLVLRPEIDKAVAAGRAHARSGDPLVRGAIQEPVQRGRSGKRCSSREFDLIPGTISSCAVARRRDQAERRRGRGKARAQESPRLDSLRRRQRPTQTSSRAARSRTPAPC